MDLYVYDSAMQRIGIVDGISSLMWTRRYQSPGEVALMTPFSEEVNAMLEVGNILMQRGGKEAMQINFKQLAKDPNDRDTIEVQGRTLMQWLDRRAMIQQINTSDLTAQAVLYRHVRENVTAPADAKRKMQQVQLREREAYDTEPIEYKSEEYTTVLESVETLLTTADMGCRVDTDENTGLHTFDFYRGNDLTDGSALPCIFSVDFENIGEQTYVHADENHKTTVYVYGAELNETVGDEAEGAERREIAVSANDIGHEYTDENGNKVTLTTAQVREKLRQRGQEELKERVVEQTFEGKINRVGALQYKRDFDVGDRVTCIYRRWGVRVDTTIMEIIEEYQDDESSVTVNFGEGTPSIDKRLRQILGN